MAKSKDARRKKCVRGRAQDRSLTKKYRTSQYLHLGRHEG